MSSTALFQILYQNETLFRVGEPSLTREPTVAKEAVETSKVQSPAPNIAAPKTAAEVIVPPKPIIVPAEKAPDFPALKHKVLILLDEPKNKVMPASEATFLDNILKAVGHSAETSDILNFSYLPGQDARAVLSEKKTNFFITFGVPLIKLNLDLLLAPYTPKFVDGIWFLLAEPLATIEADRNLKKQLWQALQKMFEMS
ncbi:hypothetical protein [Dyadobacter sp. CY323]|uniref:hypothetical protein n=1 Tax=Dyadobacter sp. CY323 TaxID=2907302 RepID=UPI001F420436|nr:hypothetical protein [Dyadobacter sp. CY323]MCE6992307.1 hypothetical protein [Dyadobacter sp. CY323]